MTKAQMIDALGRYYGIAPDEETGELARIAEIDRLLAS